MCEASCSADHAVSMFSLSRNDSPAGAPHVRGVCRVSRQNVVYMCCVLPAAAVREALPDPPVHHWSQLCPFVAVCCCLCHHSKLRFHCVLLCAAAVSRCRHHLAAGTTLCAGQAGRPGHVCCVLPAAVVREALLGHAVRHWSSLILTVFVCCCMLLQAPPRCCLLHPVRQSVGCSVSAGT
jgi:hypothetical protein